MELMLKCVVFTLLVTSVFSRTLGFVANSNNNTESSESTECNCEIRYLKHYAAKGCYPVKFDDCNCPEQFNCPTDNEIEEDKACLYKGQVYTVGSVINTSNACQLCRCLGRTNPRVFCIPRECPQLAGPLEHNCHLLYAKDACCPYGYDCVPESDNRSKEVFTCEHGGQHYPLGAKIYPDDDPCLICECDENWNGTMSSLSCHQLECVLEKNKAQFDAGCIPIYHENRCCPIEFYCPMNHVMNYSPDLMDILPNKEDSEQSGSHCVFAGETYEVGTELSINHPTNCVTCKCSVPPDFTCVHQSCPSPPSSKYCYPYFNPGQCCPQYECLVGDSTVTESEPDDGIDKKELKDEEAFFSPSVENLCLDINCEEGTKCMLYQVLCGNTTCPPLPTCLKINNECATPVCLSNCVVIAQDDNKCPVCACGDDIPKLVESSPLKCQMPKCGGVNCRFVLGNDSCPVCECENSCNLNDCPPNCNVVTEIEGRCPKCVCEDEEGNKARQYFLNSQEEKKVFKRNTYYRGCPTPVCEHEGCQIGTLFGHECPTCICNTPGDTTATTSQEGQDALQQNQQQMNQREFQEPTENEGQLDDSDESIEPIQVMKKSNNGGGNEIPEPRFGDRISYSSNERRQP